MLFCPCIIIQVYLHNYSLCNWNGNSHISSIIMKCSCARHMLTICQISLISSQISRALQVHGRWTHVKLTVLGFLFKQFFIRIFKYIHYCQNMTWCFLSRNILWACYAPNCCALVIFTFIFMLIKKSYNMKRSNVEVKADIE